MDNWDHVDFPEMLEEFATRSRDGGELSPDVRSTFDGRPVDDNGEEDDSRETYVVSFHKGDDYASFVVEFLNCT